MSSEPDIGRVEHGFQFRLVEWKGDRLRFTVSGAGSAKYYELDPYAEARRAKCIQDVRTDFPGFRDEHEEALRAKLDEWMAGEEKAKAERAKAGDSAGRDVPDAAVLLEQHDRDVQRRLEQMPPEIRDEAMDRLKDKDLIGRVEEDIELGGVVGERDVALLAYLVAVSRLLSSPLSLRIQGSSSSGKSHVLASIVAMLPPECVVIATDLTPNALYYMPNGSLIHRLVACGERRRSADDEVAEATRALRQMQSEGRLDKSVPIKFGDGIRTVQLIQFGPIGFAETTTKLDIFEEDANRCIQVCTDEGEVQTGRVLERLAQLAAGEVPADRATRVRLVHQAMQRMLRRCRVRIPFARKLVQALPCRRPEVRRIAKQMLTLVQAIALLHQQQRPGFTGEHGATIEATLDDYVIASQLLAKPLQRSLGGGLPDGTIEFLKWLKVVRPPGSLFTKAEVVGFKENRWGKSQTYEHLRQLESKGLLILKDTDNRRGRPEFTLSEDLPSITTNWLPVVRDGDLVMPDDAPDAASDQQTDYGDIPF